MICNLILTFLPIELYKALMRTVKVPCRRFFAFRVRMVPVTIADRLRYAYGRYTWCAVGPAGPVLLVPVRLLIYQLYAACYRLSAVWSYKGYGMCTSMISSQGLLSYAIDCL